jgi:hypothetical protein
VISRRRNVAAWHAFTRKIRAKIKANAMYKLLYVLPLALSFAGAGALAQNKADGQTVQELKKQDSVPAATDQNVPEKAGTSEPSSKVDHNSEEKGIFVRGVLTVPGAPTDVDTAPAKFSQRTDADDQLPIAAYRLKSLGADQRREIVQRIGDLRGSADAAHATVGAELPAAIALQALAPAPDDLVSKYPELRGTGFVRSANKVLVVDLDNSLVVGVLEG